MYGMEKRDYVWKENDSETHNSFQVRTFLEKQAQNEAAEGLDLFAYLLMPLQRMDFFFFIHFLFYIHVGLVWIEFY